MRSLITGRLLLRLLLCTMLLPLCVAAHTQAAQVTPVQGAALILQAGQTQVLNVPGVVRVVVGNGEAIQAVVLDGREVVIFARSRGQSSLHVWHGDGRRDDYDVTVNAAGTRQMQQELQALLKGIPKARSVVVGDKIVIDVLLFRMGIAHVSRHYRSVTRKSSISPAWWDGTAWSCLM